MAYCPKCGKKLRLYHWRPECPFCGVNMVYYKSNDRMLAETEQAEIEHAHSQPRIDRAKAAFFGSPAAVSAGNFLRIGSLRIGAFVYPLLILVLLVYNLVLAKKGLKVKHTVCLIGGLPSEEYFKMVEDGVPELEIRKKMVEALTVMQNEARAKEAEEEAEALQKRAERL